MIEDEQLDSFRVDGIPVRVVRDEIETNDVLGIVVAWNDEQIMIRKKNRKIVKVSRHYRVEPAAVERGNPNLPE
jgi:hypothetical protein